MQMYVQDCNLASIVMSYCVALPHTLYGPELFSPLFWQVLNPDVVVSASTEQLQHVCHQVAHAVAGCPTALIGLCTLRNPLPEERQGVEVRHQQVTLDFTTA